MYFGILIQYLVTFIAQMVGDAFWVAYGLVSLPLRMIFGVVLSFFPAGALQELGELGDILLVFFMGVGPRLMP